MITDMISAILELIIVMSAVLIFWIFQRVDEPTRGFRVMSRCVFIIGVYFLTAAVHHFMLTVDLPAMIETTLQWIHVGFDLVLVVAVLFVVRELRKP